MQIDELPLFEGHQPSLTIMNLSGKSGRRTRPFELGERICLVVEGEITRISHEETKGGTARSHTLTFDEVYELGGDRSVGLLDKLASEYREAMDEVAGRQPLPFEEEIPDEYEDAMPGASVKKKLELVAGNPDRAVAMDAQEEERGDAASLPLREALDEILFPAPEGG